MVENPDRFARAVEQVLLHEGGYRNDPRDPGGETHFGISKRTYPALNIRDLTREQAEAIYYRDWWVRFGYGAIDDDPLAAKVLDLSVNMGPGAAHKLLQEALNETAGADLPRDGVMGANTLSAVNTHPCPKLLLATVKLLAVRNYLRIGKQRYLAGWIRRAIA
ncbi:MAG: hypothetical protein LLG06_20475 [Desulfobacteraceae bacterium]|nr:hypothetical protein [Desulfobacteraceae bacterium]